jgi:hypothetical protein
MDTQRNYLNLLPRIINNYFSIVITAMLVIAVGVLTRVGL